MRAGGRILMIFGLLLAIIAGAATFLILRTSPTATGSEEPVATESVEVIVAFQTIEPWQEIPVDAIGIREYPAPAPLDAVASEVITTTATGESTTISGMEFVRGKISNTRIYPGQIIVTTQLIDKDLEEQRLGLGSNASYIVPDGKVAITIPVDQASLIAGALRAGDTVDIIASIQVPDPTNLESGVNSVAQFLLQKVQILRVGPWSVESQEGQEGGGNIVTVIVDPQQALEIKTIKEETTFEFVLRSITDEADFATQPVDLEYIIEQYNVQP